MADFMTDLWNAIFEAGPTPTLLLATNVTFAALQTLLLALFLATYSIHFVILSVLCAGLWWAINWFAAELRAAQYQQDETNRIRARQEQDNQADVNAKGSEMDAEVMQHNQSGSAADSIQPASQSGEVASGVQLPEVHSIRQRSMQEPVDSRGEPGTDSDWEHIDGER